MTEVAIVGMGCRFPGGIRGPEDLWAFLLSKGDGIVDIPADRWSLERYYDPDPEVPGRMYTKRGGFLQDSFLEFDPEFFGISPREASIMDPQQRLLLEVAQEALDDAGLGSRVAGRPVGVYVGGFTSDNQINRHVPGARNSINSHTATSGTYTMLSNRVSFVFDLRGPSMTIDTACSSSLVALHEATQAVVRGEVELALAGGANAMLSPETFVAMCKGRFLAADGRCKTFDATADGYARGEGAGMVVLKPLDAALRDGDRVYAVIRGTGSNQDGRTSGITVPNPLAQAELIRRVVAEAGIAPEQIGYIEAHGTGTAVGDPLEMSAIAGSIGAVEGRRQPLVVGSIKNSIGHLEAAAGVASVIKAALTVHHRTIAPQAVLGELNPDIPFDRYQLRVPTEPEPFPAGYPLAAVAVNGFGYGGTNAHAILTQAPAALEPAPRAAGARVFPLSGRNDAAARAVAAGYAQLLDGRATDGLATDGLDVDALVDAAWTRRARHQFRFAVPFTDRADLHGQLAALAAGEGRTGARVVAEPGTDPVFVFSGMGPQWWRMGRDLLAADGPFAAKAREIDEAFVKIAGWSIVEELGRDEADSRVSRTEIAQPANFLVQVALVAELARYGVRPSAVVGHSVGEVSAAYVSGALGLHDALLVSYHRSRLQATMAGTGVMVAVGLPEAEAQTWLADTPGICVAAVNSPSAVTLAGDRPALDALRERLVEVGVFARELKVEVPYHSHLMDPILDELVATLAELDPAAPTLPLYSTVTAGPVTDASWGARYWADNVREPVRFADAVGVLVDAGHRAFLEVGPHPVLSGNLREVLVRRGESGVSIPTLTRGQDDLDCVRAALAELYVAGVLDDAQAPGGDPGLAPHAELPSQPFQRGYLWTEEAVITRDRHGDQGARALPGDRTEASAPEWEVSLSSARLPWLRDHVVAGLVLLPGAAYLDAALSAAAALTGREQPALESVRFVSPLVVGEHEAPVVRLSVDPASNRFVIRSRSATGETWTVHATGRIVDGQVEPTITAPAEPPAGPAMPGPDLYAQLDTRGLSYGPAFRRIVEARLGDGVVVATVDAGIAAGSTHLAHPAVTDAALQCVAALVGAAEAGEGAVVPAAVRAVRMFRPMPDRVEVTVTRLPGAGLRADVALHEVTGETVLELVGVEFRPISPRQSAAAELGKYWYEPVFEPRPARDPALLPVHTQGVTTLLVALGAASLPWAGRLAQRRPGTVVVTADSGDPATVAEQVLRAVRAAVARRTGPVLVAVSCIPDDDPQAPRTTAAAIAATNAWVAGLAGTARAVQQVLDEAVLDDGQGEHPSELIPVDGVVLVRGALAVPGDPTGADVLPASLLGARRVLRNEQPNLHWRLVDADAGTPIEAVDAELLTTGSYADDDADEVALRDGVRMVLRTARTLQGRLDEWEQAAPLTDPGASFRIELPPSGLLADLALREIDRVEPGPGEVELRLDGLGLNYKDALKVLGVLGERELAGTYFGLGLGMEGLGTVTRVGPGVEGLAVGDRQIVGARDMGRRYLTVPVGDCALDPAPDRWTLADFGSGVAFMTAHYAVVHLARVQPGEVVLVHGAAGGVGMAAVQAAKHAGAVVIASAGTDERRAVATSMGADHVVNSRSLAFVEQVHALTGGRGADVVISSAPGEVLAANLAVAAEFGRIVEVGKSEIYGGRQLDLTPFDRNLSFLAMDLDRMFEHRRDLATRVQREMLALFDSGAYTPLPGTVVPVSRMAEAFELVVRSEHVGRIVLDLGEPAPLVRPKRPHTAVRPDASYLITGGFGAFGLATARWLVERGARHLVLTGRSGAATPAQREQVARFAAAGVQVVQERVDVAQPDEVVALVARIGADLPPLRGVFHTAGVVQDEPFTELTGAALVNVVAPKAIGAWNLHAALADAGVELDHFVLYASVTSLAGTVPQMPYASANAMLDALAHHRRALGLPGLSVNWGAMGGGGMAEASQEVTRYLAMLGLTPIDMERACQYLDVIMSLGVTQVSVNDVDWARWATMHPTSATTPRFSEHVQAASTGGSASSLLRAELAKLPHEQQVEVVTYILAEQLAAVLGIPAESVDIQAPLPDLGLDSLMAVELGARVNVALDVEISALEFSRGGGLSALGARLVDQMGASRLATPATNAPAPDAPTPHVPDAPAPHVPDVPATDAPADRVVDLTAGDPTSGDPSVRDQAMAAGQ